MAFRISMSPPPDGVFVSTPRIVGWTERTCRLYRPISCYYSHLVAVRGRCSISHVHAGRDAGMLGFTYMEIHTMKYIQDKGIGKWTCTKYNGRSVVDYVLCSHNLYPAIKSFEVSDPLSFSDHSAVYFSIGVGRSFHLTRPPTSYHKLIWHNDKKRWIYHPFGWCNGHIETFNALTENANSIVPNVDDVNYLVNTFVDTLLAVAETLFGADIKTGNICNKRTSSDIPRWANDEYIRARNLFRIHGDKYRMSPLPGNREQLVDIHVVQM